MVAVRQAAGTFAWRDGHDHFVCGHYCWAVADSIIQRISWMKGCPNQVGIFFSQTCWITNGY
jgi:hypothetical protein